MRQPIGNCSVCGKSARYNTPYVDDEGNLYCPMCARKSSIDKLLYGIEQYTNEEGEFVRCEYAYTYKGVVLVKCNGSDVIHAWVENGRIAYPLTTQEIECDSVKKLIEHIVKKEETTARCTGCRKDMPIEEIAGYPLFAGRVCKECWTKHIELLDDQRKRGHVCSFCGKPYGACYC